MSLVDLQDQFLSESEFKAKYAGCTFHPTVVGSYHDGADVELCAYDDEDNFVAFMTYFVELE